jgi:hypothetical protein
VQLRRCRQANGKDKGAYQPDEDGAASHWRGASAVDARSQLVSKR